MRWGLIWIEVFRKWRRRWISNGAVEEKDWQGIWSYVSLARLIVNG